MNDRPEVSVVMGVFNGAAALHDTVDSILSQDGVDYEFVIVNDGSTDGSGDVLREYAARDRRIRLIDQRNAGLTSALIKGCSEARGTFIARQDVGDRSLPDRLLIQKKAMSSDSGISFVSCWTLHCAPRGELLSVATGPGYAAHPVSILGEKGEPGLKDGPTTHPSVMFRADSYRKVGGYRPEFYYGQDWDLWYRLAEIGKFQMIQLPLYQCRLMVGSISASHKKRQDKIGCLSREAHELRRAGRSDRHVLAQAHRIRPDGKENIPKGRDAAWLYFIGEGLRRNGDLRAGTYFRQSLSINPYSVKAWIRMIQCRLSWLRSSSRKKAAALEDRRP